MNPSQAHAVAFWNALLRTRLSRLRRALELTYGRGIVSEQWFPFAQVNTDVPSLRKACASTEAFTNYLLN
jgi:hypothetical protein